MMFKFVYIFNRVMGVLFGEIEEGGWTEESDVMTETLYNNT